MSTQPIDYEALAKQAGAITAPAAASPSIDYAALAKQAGAIQPVPPMPLAPGQPHPKDFGLETQPYWKPGDELPEDEAEDFKAGTSYWDTPEQSSKAEAYNAALDAWKQQSAPGPKGFGSGAPYATHQPSIAPQLREQLGNLPEVPKPLAPMGPPPITQNAQIQTEETPPATPAGTPPGTVFVRPYAAAPPQTANESILPAPVQKLADELRNTIGVGPFGTPFEGADEIAKGVYQIGDMVTGGVNNAEATPKLKGTPAGPVAANQGIAGLANIVRGGLKIGSVLVPYHAIMSPVATVATLATYELASKGTEEALKAAGVPQDYSELAGDIAGMGAGAAIHSTGALDTLKGMFAPGGRFGEGLDPKTLTDEQVMYGYMAARQAGDQAKMEIFGNEGIRRQASYASDEFADAHGHWRGNPPPAIEGTNVFTPEAPYVKRLEPPTGPTSQPANPEPELPPVDYGKLAEEAGGQPVGAPPIDYGKLAEQAGGKQVGAPSTTQITPVPTEINPAQDVSPVNPSAVGQPVQGSGVPAVASPAEAEPPVEPVAASGINVPPPQIVQQKEEEKPQPHEFSSTQANLSGPVAEQIKAAGQSIPQDQQTEKGVEEQPHITALYGLHTEDVNEVRPILEKQPPLTATLGTASVFHTPEADVLKVSVESPDLHRINGLLRDLPHTNDFPNYEPHVTIAYLKPGQGQKYDGMELPGITGQQITLNSIAFSGKDGQQVEIPLKGTPESTEPALMNRPSAETGAPESSITGSIPPSNLQPNAATSSEVVRSSAAVQRDLDNFKPLPGETAKQTAGRKGILTAELMRATVADMGNDRALAEAAERIRKQREAAASKQQGPQTIDITPQPESQTDLSQRILKALQTRPGGMGTMHLRQQLGADKPAFDQAMLSLYRNRQIHMDEHDWPGGLSEAQKEEMVTDGAGKFYVNAGIRAPEAPAVPGVAPAVRLAHVVAERLAHGVSLGNQPQFYQLAEQFFGSPRTSGQWDVKDAMDAMEAGVNKYLVENGSRLMQMDPIQALAELRKLQSLLPTQGTRTDEQLKAQQFSTPPGESFVAAKAAGIQPSDVVLEPSAGNGGLAAWPKSIGAQVHVNEISDRRAQMLEAAGFGKPTAHDGELINALLDPSVKPTVVLMNPPFSSGALKSHQGKNRNEYGFNHVDQALQRLQPGGRLVAILGGGRADDLNGGASFTGGKTGKWFDRVRKLYSIRANVRINGKEYQKYGTNFATRILVIDKTGPTPNWSDALVGKGNVVQGNADTLEQAYNLLKDVAGDRQPAQVPAGTGNAVRPGQGQPPTPAGTGQGATGISGGTLPAGDNRPPETGQLPPGSHGPASVAPGVEPNPVREPVPLQQPGPESATPTGVFGSPGSESSPKPDELGQVPGDGQSGQDIAATLTEPLTGDENNPSAFALEREDAPTSEKEDTAAYVAYHPSIKGGKHPGDIVETKTMATVPLPPITAKVNLPPDVGISSVQMEGVAIAAQQNEILLPDGARSAALIGDGTGVGKGREAAAYLWHNFRSGRKRLVWVSEKWDLIQDAMRDLTGIGAKEMLTGVEKQPDGKFVVTPKSSVQPFNRWKYGVKIEHQGMVFSTYGTVRAKDKKGNRRVAQLEEYLRGNDDGEGAAIVFDEAHNLKNAVPARGTPASQIGQAVKQLLERIPKLRTLSLSATAATDVVNLGYLDRLGLWGAGTPFPNGFSQFQNQIARGGLSAMEMIARELKAQGKYISRTLSFHGVEYDTAEHQLTDEQKELYRTAATAWGTVLDNASSTIANVTNGGGEARGNFLSQFYGAQQRFFNVLITTLKVPTAVDLATKALADGKAVVISLVNTNEAAQNREKNKARDEDDEDEIPDFDFGPKEMLVNLVRDHYPTQQWADDVNDNGDPIKVPVYTTDADGREIAVQNPTAIAARDALIEQINQDLHMPDNPLDILIQSLGGEKKVAELTGRKERFDRNTGKFVHRGDPNVPQKDTNLVEMRKFQAGKKNVAVLSGAAGTGISLHAGNDVANQKPRYHITLQVGWSADKAMQMFGRTHRTNQKQPPQYVMLVSDLGGEKRFVSTISRRLGSLGALTKGQKNATGGTDLMDKVNFETDQGRQATNTFYERMLQDGPVPGTDLTGRQILSDLHVLKRQGNQGETVPPAERTNVTRLLNRLLALDPDTQNAVYNYFYDIFQATVQDAIDRGQLDTGVKALPGDDFDVKEERGISKDPKTGAQTFYYPVDAKMRTKRVSPAELKKRLVQYSDDHPAFMVNDKGQIALLIDAPPIVHASGSVEPAFYTSGPGRGQWIKISRNGIRGAKEVSEYAQNELTKAKEDLRRADSEVQYYQSSLARNPGYTWTQNNLAKAQAEQNNAKDALARAEEISQNPTAWAKKQWGDQYAESPSHFTEERHLIGGAVLRFWNPIVDTIGRPEIYTAVDSKTGKRVVGVDIPKESIGELLQRITGGASTVNASQLITDVLRNNLTYTLEGGIQIRQGRVGGERVIQVIPPNRDIGMTLKNMGVRYEKGVLPVYYVPTEEKGPMHTRQSYVVGKILEQFPVQQNREGFLSGESGAFTPGEARKAVAETLGKSAESTRQAIGARTNAVEALKSTLDEESDKNTGAKIRTLVTGERDIRIAEANQLRDNLKKLIPDHIDQEALTLIRDFKGRPGELEQFLNGTHAAIAEHTKPEEQAEAIGRLEQLRPVIQRALNPVPELLKADQALTDFYAAHLAEGQKLGFLNSEIPNEEYVTHLLNPAKQNEKPSRFGQLFRGKLGPRKFKFAKHRNFETVLHAVAAYPKAIRSLNALDALGVYGEKYGTTAAYHILMGALRKSAAGKWGTFSQQKAGKIPADWVELSPESRIFRHDVPYNDEEGNASVAHQMLFVPPKIEEALRPVLDPNYMNRVPGFQKGRLYQAYIKTLELGLSVFHLRAMNVSALGNANLDGMIETYLSDMKSPEFQSAERSWIRAGLVTPVLDRTVEVYKALQPTSLPTTAEKIRSIPGLKQIDKLASAISHLTFGIVQRKMKVTDASIQYASWLARHPNATPEEGFEAQRQIAKQVNATYGGLHWENMGVNRMTVELSKAFLLAPDWTYSNLLNLKYAGEGGPAGRAARLFWIRSAVWGLALTAGMSLIMGKKLYKDPTEVYLGKDQYGNDLHQNLFFAGAPGDLVSWIHQVARFGAVVGTARFLAGKMGPFPKAGVHLMTNQDAQGKEIVGKTVNHDLLGKRILPRESGPVEKTAAGLKEVSKDVMPVPFTVSTIGKMLTDPKRTYSMAEYLSAALAGKMPQAEQLNATELRKQITDHLRNGELNDARELFQKGIAAGVITQHDLVPIVKAASVPKDVKTFQQQSTEAELEIYANASDEDKRQFLPTLVKKIGPSLVKAPPLEQKRILDLLVKAGITPEQVHSVQ